MRCTATAGVPATFHDYFSFVSFGCAPPLPPPAVGELDSLGRRECYGRFHTIILATGAALARHVGRHFWSRLVADATR